MFFILMNDFANDNFKSDDNGGNGSNIGLVNNIVMYLRLLPSKLCSFLLILNSM